MWFLWRNVTVSVKCVCVLFLQDIAYSSAALNVSVCVELVCVCMCSVGL